MNIWSEVFEFVSGVVLDAIALVTIAFVGFFLLGSLASALCFGTGIERVFSIALGVGLWRACAWAMRRR